MRLTTGNMIKLKIPPSCYDCFGFNNGNIYTFKTEQEYYSSEDINNDILSFVNVLKKYLFKNLILIHMKLLLFMKIKMIICMVLRLKSIVKKKQKIFVKQ